VFFLTLSNVTKNYCPVYSKHLMKSKLHSTERCRLMYITIEMLKYRENDKILKAAIEQMV
jgi:hypothetical protein